MSRIKIFIFATIIYSSVFSGAVVLEAKSNKLKIYILSKQVRLLKERKLKKIELHIFDSVKIEDRLTGKFLETRNAELSYVKQKWILKTPHQIYKNNFHLKLYSEKKDQFVTVKINQERRKYPAEFEVICDSDIPRFYVKEDIKRYAVDSAIAEYGRRNKYEHEAVNALAQIIYARAFYQRKNPVYKGYLFSDLTDSQVYRGRLSFNHNKFFVSGWQIDWRQLKEQLFFHACCGGKIFSSSVFGYTQEKLVFRKDYLYRSGDYLCKTAERKWSRVLSKSDLQKIFKISDLQKIHKFASKNYIRIISNKGNKNYSLETFRLIINRRRGWNFLKSNNYQIKSCVLRNQPAYQFAGYGLGHGTGLCQQGALALARKGFNSFEIIEHYYPGVKFYCDNNEIFTSPYLSYCMFDFQTGEIISSSNASVINRKFPSGSFWKIVIALYLAKERPDIFQSYRYACKGVPEHKQIMPERCWTIEGHGKLNIEGALAHSCNLFFASLNEKIDYRDFKLFFEELKSSLRLNIYLPEIKSKKAWARYLCGLDFRYTLTPKELIKIYSLIYPGDLISKEVDSYKRGISEIFLVQIYESLEKVFVSGTASGKIKKNGSANNYKSILKAYSLLANNKHDEFWGKTSTVLDGTNRPVNYGMFIGGNKKKGIMVFLRKGNGHLAAKWSIILLNKKLKKLANNN
jgi:SpoIID/LytB domain protein